MTSSWPSKGEIWLEDRSWLFAQLATNALNGVVLGTPARDDLDSSVTGSRVGVGKQLGGLEAH